MNVVLRCSNCGKLGHVEDQPVGGLSVTDWFNARGRRCTDCYNAAGGALGHAQQLVKPPPGSSRLSHQAAFEQFHQLNPWVFDALEELASELIGHGRRRIGMKMLFEVLRWQYERTTTDLVSDFKLNNNYHSRYSRALIAKHPEWADCFEVRELRAA